MWQKKLVYDVVFITGNESVFELRFQKLRESVDYFLIFGTENSLKKIETYYVIGDPKIKTFPIDESFTQSLENAESISTLILDTITKFYSSFEDLIFFSFSNEIPDLDSLEEMDVKSKTVNFLMCDVFEGSFDRKRKYLEIGSILFNFSHLLKNKKNFLNQFFHFKSNMKSQDVGIKNGFKILNYSKSTDNLPDYYQCSFSGKFVEYIFERTHRKFGFFYNVDSENLDFDYIFKIKFVDKFPEKCSIDLRNKIQEIEVFLPNTPLYFATLSDFQSNYKINQIKRLLSVFDCKDTDDVEIYYENESVKKLKFHEIKNPSF